MTHPLCHLRNVFAHFNLSRHYTRKSTLSLHTQIQQNPFKLNPMGNYQKLSAKFNSQLNWICQCEKQGFGSRV